MHYTRLLLGINYLILAVISTAMFFGTDWLVSVYNLSSEAAAISHVLLRAHCAAMILWPAAFTLPNALRAAMEKMGATKVDHGDAGYQVEFLPGLFMQILVWEGDDEFPPNSQILFSDNFAEAFAAEDRVVCADILIGDGKCHM